ncbi:hypothetical protein [Bradyrhizobium sp. STM 3561]|uniref:hypothetical protein n=1 Tax=Bradyrhizobium sp. STM 3561 TaxID=578923 RepID=UPI00388E06EB
MPNVKNSISGPRRPNRVRPQVQAQHVDYALHTLGWASFQDLCASIFEVVFDRAVSVYSKTHDGGRDGSFKGLVSRPQSSRNSCDSTLQTKHVSRVDASLTLAGLTPELKKIKRLVKQGRATGHVLMTNAVITATEAEKIERAIIKEGVQEACVLGRDWINKKIHEHPKIRATVPRLYGLAGPYYDMFKCNSCGEELEVNKGDPPQNYAGYEDA